MRYWIVVVDDNTIDLMDGFEEEHNRSATPVIFLSGGGDSGTSSLTGSLSLCL